MNKGILYVAFGSDYLLLTLAVIKYSRQYTSLPICVLTNIKERGEEWNKIENVSFVNFDLEQVDNRVVKTQMIDHTPFDKTLYLDCDSVIQNYGIENVFDLLDKDLVLNLCIYWHKKSKIVNIYKKAMKATGTVLPLKIYNGAFICFKKNDKVIDFFYKWNKFWVQTGSGREMQALACAAKQSDIDIAEINKYVHGFFEPEIYNPDCIVQHNYNSNQGKNFFKEFSLPVIRQCKPFDFQGSQNDWSWVEFD